MNSFPNSRDSWTIARYTLMTLSFMIASLDEDVEGTENTERENKSCSVCFKESLEMMHFSLFFPEYIWNEVQNFRPPKNHN